MIKIIKGDLILTEDTIFEESIIVEGSIKGDYNLIVKGDLNCKDLCCLDLNCWDLKCGDLNCKDLCCLDLNCGYLNCGDLSCKDLNCWDLNCKGAINYYAVCFAYNDIKCKSIKGRRENCKHFVLNGKMIIDGKEEENE